LIAVGGGDVASQPILTYLALVVAAGMVVVRILLPALSLLRPGERSSRNRRRASSPQQPDNDAGKLAQVFVVRTIISAAILEGAAFFLLIAYLVEHSPLSVAFAVVLIVALALHIPTTAKSRGLDRRSDATAAGRVVS